MAARIPADDQRQRLREMRDRQKLGNANAIVLNQAGKNLTTLEKIAALLPTEDEWQSAAGIVEAIAETLDRAKVERPAHYRPDTDIR